LETTIREGVAPWSPSNAYSPAQTDYVELEGRPHLMMAAEGWEEIAPRDRGLAHPSARAVDCQGRLRVTRLAAGMLEAQR
jgi:hypothetical protein